MRFDGLYVAATACHLPPRVSVGTAISEGACDTALAGATGMVSVTESRGESGPELAANAARTSLVRSGVEPAEIDLVLHASSYHQGHELWAPASYVQRFAVGNRCPAMQVGQVSNGGMAALELGTRYVLASPSPSAVLLTTGDRFAAPGFDRWRSDPGTVYADGGTALVVTRRAGFAAIRSLVTVSRPDLEGMHRGTAPFSVVPYEQGDRVDLDARKNEFVTEVGKSFMVSGILSGQEEAIKGALADAETELADIDWFVLPHLGQRRLTASYFTRFGIDPDRSTWPWSRTVGHLGAGDQFAGLDHLVTTGAASPGDRCLLVSVGAGFSWSCAVVDILRTPDWAK